MGLGLGLEAAGERAAQCGCHAVPLVPCGQLVAQPEERRDARRGGEAGAREEEGLLVLGGGRVGVRVRGRA